MEYCTESGKQSDCLGPAWLYVYGLFSLVMVGLTGAARVTRHHERGLSHVSPAWGKMRIRSLKYGFY